MPQLNYTFVPARPPDTPLYRKGWKPTKPRPRSYPKPAASIEAAAVLTASREHSKPMIRLAHGNAVPAPAAQNNDVGFPYALVSERPLDTPLHRKGWRSIKPKPRPYPKPVGSIGVSRRRSREDARPLVPGPLFQNATVFQDNCGFLPLVPDYVAESEIDAMGPVFITVAPSTTYGNPLPNSAETVTDITLNGALPGIQVIVGYVPELPEAMEVDWEGPLIQSDPSCHLAFNIPSYGGSWVMVENVLAPMLGILHSSLIMFLMH